MKIYINNFDLAQPMARKITVAPYSTFGIGVKVLLNGQPTESPITLEIGSTPITAESDLIDGYTIFKVSSNESGNVQYDVKCAGQTFYLTQIVNGEAGSFETADEGGGSSTKYGASLDIWLGDVDENGALQSPTVTTFAFESDEIRTFNVQGAAPLSGFRSFVSSINLPNLASVGSYSMWSAFKGMTNLTSVNLPALTTIDEGGMLYAFQNSTNLTSVNLPALTTLGQEAMQDAFNGCTKLTSISISGLTSVTGVLAMYNLCKGCTSLKSVVFDSLVTAAGMANAFQNCTALEYVSMPNLTTITTSGSSDYGCQEIFNGCTSLKVVDIPKWSQCAPIATMYMFKGCTSLQYVNISQATAIPDGSNVSYMFANTNDTFKVIVPDALYDSWIAATGWSNIATHIVKASEYPVIMTPYNGQDNMDNN